MIKLSLKSEKISNLQVAQKAMNNQLNVLKIACKTTFKADVFDPDYAFACYYDLVEKLPWVDGVPSKSGKTRKAHSCQFGQDNTIDNLIVNALTKLTTQKYLILGVYVNYYADGSMWTPGHSHAGSHQLVISLGATRTLNVAKQSFQMTSGSAILFGSAHHGVPKEGHVFEGRISIATFMKPIAGDNHIAVKLN